ncbi:acylphosphatase [Sphingomonas sp. LY54]|uniref:acylphosphatase n=1 Tax=Sphingomonas sp. LY54 TaxID=3095343 RepID=UPI002D775CFD|nr:acylphosphatase [Sphingomonas sp. LY54]WRP29855.1 acylphosphatase [Sphingomonas sp. LY54]
MISRRLIISGRVQGVFYRGWTVEIARALGVGGWVRNRRTGEVEIVATGSAEAVDALIERCWQGPSAARVDDIAIEELPVEPHDGFGQRPTA